MNPKPYTAIPSPEIAAELDMSLAELSAEIAAQTLPKLAAVVLGGGYGRGEGGVLRTPEGDRLYNDLDLFVFADGAGRGEIRRITTAMRQLAVRWEKRLGIAVDFSPVKNISELPRLSGKLLYQELVRSWRPVWGNLDLAAQIPQRPPRDLPFSEAARLLLNRGMGLIFAGGRLTAWDADADFIMRNLHKSQLGGGDALLIAAGEYRWRSVERTAVIRDAARAGRLPAVLADNYERAWHYKTCPVPVMPADPLAMWRECRACFLDAARRTAGCPEDATPDDVAAALHRRAAGERSLRNALRWLLRARTYRPPVTAFDPPEVTVAARMYRVLADGPDCPECPADLYRLWGKFN